MGVDPFAQPHPASGGPALPAISHRVAPSVWFAAVAVVAMLVAGTAVYRWQHPKVTDAEAASARVETQLAAEQQTASSLRGTIESLRQERAHLRETSDVLAARLQHVSGRRGELSARIAGISERLVATRGELAQVETRLTELRAQLTKAHGRAILAGGGVLANGRYTGQIQGIDVKAAPARIAIRVTHHGGGSALANPGWRVFALREGALVRLATWKGGKDVVSLSQFEHIFDGQASWNARMRDRTYWIQVFDGRITGLGEAA